MQIKFFNQVPIFFLKLPNKLLLAVPNGGSRNIIEAKNLKPQGVKTGVSDVLLLIAKKKVIHAFVRSLKHLSVNNRMNKKNSKNKLRKPAINMYLSDL